MRHSSSPKQLSDSRDQRNNPGAGFIWLVLGIIALVLSFYEANFYRGELLSAGLIIGLATIHRMSQRKTSSLKKNTSQSRSGEISEKMPHRIELKVIRSEQSGKAA